MRGDLLVFRGMGHMHRSEVVVYTRLKTYPPEGTVGFDHTSHIVLHDGTVMVEVGRETVNMRVPSARKEIVWVMLPDGRIAGIWTHRVIGIDRLGGAAEEEEDG